MKRSSFPGRLRPAGSNMSKNDLDSTLTRMVDLLAQETGLMEKIFNLTNEQSKLLTPEKAGELLTIIERKQECINEISLIDTGVAALEKEVLRLTGVSAWPEVNKTANVKLQEVDNMRQQVVQLLEKTRKLENDNLDKISYEHQKLKSGIESLQAKRETLRAYQGHTLQSDGYFIDKKK